VGIKVEFQADVDASQVTSAINQLTSQWSTATAEMKEAVNKALGGDVVKTVEIQYKENAQGVKEAVAIEKDRYTVLDEIVKLREKETKAMPGSLTSLRQQLNTQLKTRDALSQYVSVVENGVLKGKQLNGEWVTANQQVTAIRGALDQASGSGFFDKVATTFNESGIANFLRGVGNLVQGFQSLVIVFQQITASFDQFVNAQKKIQGLELTFKSIGQGATGGAEALKSAADISQNLGVSLDTTLNGFKQLTPVVLNSGGTMNDVSKITEALSSRFVAFGKSADESKRIMNAVIQAFGKGKLASEELNQQIAEADPAFRTDLASAVGVSSSELELLVKNGKITAAMLIDILPKMGKTAEIFKLAGMSASEAAEALGKVDATGRSAAPTLEQISNKIATINQLTLISLSGEFDGLIKAIFQIQAAFADFFASVSKNDLLKGFADVLGDLAQGFANVISVTLTFIDVVASLFSGLGTIVSLISDVDLGFASLGEVLGTIITIGLGASLVGWAAGMASAAKEAKALGTALFENVKAKAQAVAESRAAAAADSAELNGLVAKNQAEKAAAAAQAESTAATNADTAATRANTTATNENIAAQAAQAKIPPPPPPLPPAGGLPGAAGGAADAAAAGAANTLTTAKNGQTAALNTNATAAGKDAAAVGALAVADEAVTGAAATSAGAVAGDTAAKAANATTTATATVANTGFIGSLKNVQAAAIAAGASIKAFLLSPMGAIILAVAGIGIAVQNYQSQFKGAEEVTKGFGDSINEIDKSLQESGASITASKDAWESTKETVGGVVGVLDNVKRAINLNTQGQNYYAESLIAGIDGMEKFRGKMADMDSQIQKDIAANDGSAKSKQALTSEIDQQTKVYQKQIATNKAAILTLQQRTAADEKENFFLQDNISLKQRQVAEMEREIAANERLKASLGLVTQALTDQIEAQKAAVDLAKAQQELVTVDNQAIIDAAQERWDKEKEGIESAKEKMKEKFDIEKKNIDEVEAAENKRHDKAKQGYEDQKTKINETYDIEKARLDELKAKIEETYDAKLEKLRDPTVSEAALKELEIADLQRQAASATTNEERLRARAALERIEADKQAAEIEKQKAAELKQIEDQQKAAEKQKEAELAVIKQQERTEDRTHAANMEKYAQQQIDLAKAKDAADKKFRDEQKKAAETYGPIIEAAEAKIQAAKAKTQEEQEKLKNLEKSTGDQINVNTSAQQQHTTAIQNSANAVRNDLIKSYQDLGTTIKNLPKPPPAATPGSAAKLAFAGGPVTAGELRTVNELGQEAFLTSSGKLSWINAPSWGQWRAPSSGTVIPAHIAAGLGIPSGGTNINRSTVRSVSSTTSNGINASSMARLLGIALGSNAGTVNNSVVINSDRPAKTASDMLVEMTKIRRNRYS
jgi:tape measure domain-containing protein